jgi:hypothetical protein
VRLPADRLAFLLFPVQRLELFDAVVTGASGAVLDGQVKRPMPDTWWVWGAMRMPGRVFHELHELWRARVSDEYEASARRHMPPLGRLAMDAA